MDTGFLAAFAGCIFSIACMGLILVLGLGLMGRFGRLVGPIAMVTNMFRRGSNDEYEMVPSRYANLTEKPEINSAEVTQKSGADSFDEALAKYNQATNLPKGYQESTSPRNSPLSSTPDLNSDVSLGKLRKNRGRDGEDWIIYDDGEV